MNMKDFVKDLGIAVLVVGISALAVSSSIKHRKEREAIIRNPARFIEYRVKPNDGIDKLVRKYSNVPHSIYNLDVREYVKEINGKEAFDSGLYIGEIIKLPVYEE